MSTNQEFREAIGGLFREMAVAVNEIADACKENELRERFFAFKRCFERGVILCSGGHDSESCPPKPRGEEAPEFAAEKGESVRIVEL